MLWKHRTKIVFNGTNASIQLVLRQIFYKEAHLWCLAGARCLSLGGGCHIGVGDLFRQFFFILESNVTKVLPCGCICVSLCASYTPCSS